MTQLAKKPVDPIEAAEHGVLGPDGLAPSAELGSPLVMAVRHAHTATRSGQPLRSRRCMVSATLRRGAHRGLRSGWFWLMGVCRRRWLTVAASRIYRQRHATSLLVSAMQHKGKTGTVLATE
jgi:hypothetical protein